MTFIHGLRVTTMNLESKYSVTLKFVTLIVYHDTSESEELTEEVKEDKCQQERITQIL